VSDRRERLPGATAGSDSREPLWRATDSRPGDTRYGDAVTVWETLLVFGVLPLAGFGLLALLVYGPTLTRSVRYRPGRDWQHDPVWYVARPEVDTPASSAADRAAIEAAADRPALPDSAATRRQPPASVLDAPARTARGGASGEW
jgi:hypothetical protein